MLKRLKIWQKFLLIALSFCIPIVILVYFLYDESAVNINFSKAELDGTQYWRSLRVLIIDVQLHRDLANVVLAGDASFKADLEKKEADIEEDFKNLETTDNKYVAEFVNTSDMMKTVKQTWGTVKSTYAAGKPEQSFDLHSRLIRMLNHYTQVVGNDSNLIMDPDIDTYYTQDNYVFKGLKLSEEVSQARAIGAALIASGGQGDENSARRGQLAPALIRIDDALTQLNDTEKYALDATKSAADALQETLNANTKITRAFIVALNDKVLNGASLMPLKEFWAQATGVIDAQTALAKAEIELEDQMLQKRIDGLSKKRMTEIAIAAIGIIVTLLIMFGVIRSITKPVAHLSQIADRISLGEMDVKIDIDSKDEIGELGERFRRLQVSLKAAMDQLERQDGDSG